jgi:predicted nuclease with TOPRIM domain
MTSRLEILKKANDQLSTTTQVQKAEIVRMTRLSSEAADLEAALKVAEENIRQLKSELSRANDSIIKEKDRGLKLTSKLDEAVRRLMLLLCSCCQ